MLQIVASSDGKQRFQQAAHQFIEDQGGTGQGKEKLAASYEAHQMLVVAEAPDALICALGAALHVTSAGERCGDGPLRGNEIKGFESILSPNTSSDSCQKSMSNSLSGTTAQRNRLLI